MFEINFKYLRFLLLVVFVKAVICTNELNGQYADIILKLRNKVQDKVAPTSTIYPLLEDDLYLLQWLKANSYNVNAAEAHFLDHLSWRRARNVDMVLMEDWAQYQEEYPIYTDTIDKSGRPIAEVWLSDWNIRRALMIGRGQKLMRWNIYMLEIQQKRVFEIRRDGNQNVTGAVEIMDFQGFNAWNQGCPPCLPVFLGMLHTWVKHYGGTWDNIYMVNMSPSFYSVLKLVGIHLGSAAKVDILQPFQSKREWLPILDAQIEKNQRSTRFGGTLIRSSGPGGEMQQRK